MANEKDWVVTDLYHAFTATEALHGKKPAIKFIEEVDQQEPSLEWNYHELMDNICKAANLFHQCGIDETKSVGLLVPNVPYGQVALFAAELAGKSLPVNPLLHNDHIIGLLNAANTTILVVADSFERALEIQKQVPTLKHIFSLESGDLCLETAMSHCTSQCLEFSPRTDPNAIVATFHTGGTTGTPKLVQHYQSNQIAVAKGMANHAGISSDDVIINALPLFHVAGSMCFAISSILAGASQVLCTKQGARHPDFISKHWDMIENQQVTIMGGVPTTIGAIAPSIPKEKPKTLQKLVTGGAVLPVSVQDAFTKKLGIPPLIIYGMTECAGLLALTQHDCATLPAGWTGRAVDGMEIRVVKTPSDANSTVPCMETGHVIARGTTVGPGYTDPTLNETAFTKDGWLITGDLGLMDAKGNLKLTGRAKDLIIRSGHNIDPVIIEDAALEHPHVTAAAAVGAPDGYAGELPVLFVQSSVGKNKLDTNALLSLIKEQVERPAVPKWVEVLETIPVTPVGKIYKPALLVLAIEKTLRTHLEQLNNTSISLQVIENNGVPVVYWTAPAESHQLIKGLMAPFALEYQFTE